MNAAAISLVALEAVSRIRVQRCCAVFAILKFPGRL